MTSRWAVVVQGAAAPGADVVVFLPPAGSVTSPYFPVAARLPASVAAAHCEIPGRGRLAGDAAPASVGEAVDRWAEELVALLPGRRLHVFGHSLGAFFAYELVTRFGDRSACEVAALLVSGAREPGSAPRSAVATAFAALRREQRAADRDDDAGWLAEDLRMRREYRPPEQVVSTPLALLSGRSDTFVRPGEMGEWKRFTSGPQLGTFTFDGGHDYYLSDPDAVAATITDLVDRSRNPGTER